MGLNSNLEHEVTCSPHQLRITRIHFVNPASFKLKQKYWWCKRHLQRQNPKTTFSRTHLTTMAFSGARYRRDSYLSLSEATFTDQPDAAGTRSNKSKVIVAIDWSRQAWATFNC